MRELFEHDNSDAVLLIDASNAFNSLNRAAALHNIGVLCPSIATYTINTYREPARLFIIGGQELRSSEGTTQGDPLAMSLYAISLQPLITRLQVKSAASQCWYADDAIGCGSLGDVKTWWDELMVSGPPLGYIPNPQKCWLIVKPEKERPAKEIFSETNINITTEGRKHLGAALGSRAFFEEYVDERVEEWVAQVTRLAEFATTQPQSSYAAFVFGLRHWWTYLLRTLPGLAPFLEPLECAIADLLVPAIIEHATIQEEQDLLELPQAQEPPDKTEIKTLPANARREKDELLKRQCEQVRESLSSKSERAVELAAEKGASNWLTVIPIKEMNFNLNKREFRGAIKLRYDWEIADLRAMCTCGDFFTVDHAMVCRHGGLIIQRHNEIRDLEAEMLRMVCTDKEREPVLQKITGEEPNRGANRVPDARLDIHARRFWDRQQSAFFDVRVCHPNADSYRELSPKQIFQLLENEKKRQYSRRVLEVEQATFTPLVFTSTGGMADECKRFHSRLAELLALKIGDDYATTLSWIRAKISFAILRSALLCLRGTRRKRRVANISDTDITSESAQDRI
ncbi:hypothetical protein AWC38_SpisGene1544 [Stylophora pistillata]|uniref:SWIM-type domain-containing protein n=1 Tax=Stylophora pistillata TaxID=50429 RepID=A0A2B4SYM0_STYPI|nr:hypothetical protein AWC38_SpisGene1544 [Stylophora pistillata]